MPSSKRAELKVRCRGTDDEPQSDMRWSKWGFWLVRMHVSFNALLLLFEQGVLLLRKAVVFMVWGVSLTRRAAGD